MYQPISQTPTPKPTPNHSFTVVAKQIFEFDDIDDLDEIYNPRTNPRHYYHRALHYFLKGEYRAAIENAVRGIDKHPMNPIWEILFLR